MVIKLLVVVVVVVVVVVLRFVLLDPLDSLCACATLVAAVIKKIIIDAK
jgi:hypothetical protein